MGFNRVEAMLEGGGGMSFLNNNDMFDQIKQEELQNRYAKCAADLQSLQARLTERTEQSMATACRDAETIRKLRAALDRIAQAARTPNLTSVERKMSGIAVEALK